MAVIFFNSAKVWGGGEKWHCEISGELFSLGWDTVVITNKKSELYNRVKASGQKLYKIKISNLSFLNPLKLFILQRIFRIEKADTVIINLSADLKVAGLAAKIAGVKRIIYRRGSAIPIKKSFLNRFLFKRIVTDILANSEETKKTINKNNKGLFPSEKIKVIYNGLDFNKYKSAAITRQFPREQNTIIIGNLGRFVRQKGQHHLVKLAAILKERKIPAKILIGGAGPLNDELESLIKNFQVEDMVHLPGFIDDVKGFMTSLDIFVLTSLWEGFGYVIAEAMYFEKPVIAYNVSSNPELIQDGKTGFLVKLGDINAIADKIEFLYNHIELLIEIGREGKKFVTENLSIPKTLSEVIDFLKNKRD